MTSGALILMFAFLVLSTGPGYEIKSLAVGIAAGIIFDATVIRALLVPALMSLFGDANWWMPAGPRGCRAGRPSRRGHSGGTTEAPPERGLWWCGAGSAYQSVKTDEVRSFQP